MKKFTKEEEYAVIRRVIGGEKQAYRLLVKQYERYVFSAAYKIMGNRHDAEDVAQDAFVKAFHSLEKFKFESRFSTWIYRIAINTAISKKRKKKFHTQDINEVQVKQSVTNDHALKTQEQKQYIQQAFDDLKEDDVVMLTLFYLKELHLDEIADILSIEVNNAKVKLYRARKRLAEQLRVILNDEVETLI